MEKNWVCIFSTNQSFEAEMTKEMLLNHGIQVVNINKQDSNYLFGLIEVYVDRAHAIRAKHLVENFQIPDAPDDESNS